MVCVLLLIISHRAGWPERSGEHRQEAEAKPAATILVLPLDDRPANTYFPRMVGQAGGASIELPPPESLGDAGALSLWLLENGAQADGFVIAADMLAYGGLVESREGGRTLETAMPNLAVLCTLKEKFPTKPIYVYSIIQRLAANTRRDEDWLYSRKIRQWAELADQVENLGQEEYRAVWQQLEQEIPAGLLADYRLARSRNHRVNGAMIEWVAAGWIDYLILGQDDAGPYGLHRAEREKLQAQITAAGLGEQAIIFPGADEIDMVLIARLLNERAGLAPRIAVLYSGSKKAEWTAPFDDLPLGESIARHITAAGGVVAGEDAAADIVLAVNTPSEGNREADLRRFGEGIRDRVQRGQLVAVADVAETNGSDVHLVRQLRETVNIPELAAYAGWNTAGNTVGMAVGHAASRYALLQKSEAYPAAVYDAAARAHAEFLLHRLAKDYGYKRLIYPAVSNYVTRIGASPNRLGAAAPDVNRFVQERLGEQTEQIFREDFRGRRVLVRHLRGKRVYSSIRSLDRVVIGFPWDRIFETRVEPLLTLTGD